MQDPPTFIRITNASPRRVYSGRGFTLKFETDARSDYFSHPDSFIAIISPPSFGQYTGTANVQNGHGVAYFKASDGLGAGTQGQVTLEVRPPRATSLSASIELEVVPLPEATGPTPGTVPTPNINPRWVKEGDPLWKDEGWDRTSVAKVTREDDAADIWVSADNEKLATLIVRAQRKDMTAVDNVKAMYLEHISYFALLQDLEREQGGTGDDLDVEGTKASRTLAHACDTICGIIESLFEVIATSPPATV